MRPVHFEIHAADQERCANFYKNVFSWNTQKVPMGTFDYWVVTTGEDGTPGINGGIIRRVGENPPPKESTPVIGFVNTIEVEDIDATIAKVVENGGVEALGKNNVPGVGVMAYYKDTESNIFGILQPEKAAASS